MASRCIRLTRIHAIQWFGYCDTFDIRVESHANALAFYQRLREANRGLGCHFFEGVVMNRADSAYPVQFRSATEEFRGWVKHRFVT